MRSIEVQIRSGQALRAASVFFALAAGAAMADEPNGGAFITSSAARSSGPGHPWQGGPQNVNPYSFNKCTRIPLVSWESLGPTRIELDLYHNSYGPIVQGAMGRKWSHSYDAYVITSVDRQRAAVVWGDRRIQMFRKSGQTWVPDDGYRDLLRTEGADFELARKDGTRFLFGSRGLPSAQPRYRMFAIVDRSDNRVHLEHDSVGRLVRVDDPTGRSLRFTYDNARVQSVELFALGYSRIWRFEHGPAGQLSRIDWPQATTDQGPQDASFEFGYDARSNIVRVVDSESGNWTYGYQMDRLAYEQAPGNDASSRTRFASGPGGTRTVTDPVGVAAVYEYDGLSRLVRSSDAGGNQTIYSYSDPDYAYGPSRVASPDGSATGLDYDSRANVVGRVDAAGNRWDYAYDSQDRLIRELAPLVTDAWGVRQSDRNRTEYQYDSRGNLLLVRRFKPVGSEDSSYEYDAYGNLVRAEESVGNITTYTYDAYGNLVAVRSPEGRQTLRLFETEMLSMGLTAPNAIIDGLGRRTDLAYDERGRLVARTVAGYPPERYQYDAMDRLVRGENGSGLTTFSYNGNGWLEQETGRGGWVRYSYRPNGLVQSVQGVTPNTSVLSDYGYDYRNLVDRASQGGDTVQFSYDAAGRLVRKLLPNGASSHYGYTAARLSSVVNIDRTGMPISVFAYEYQSDGRLAATTELDGSATRYGYDALGRIVREERRGAGAYHFEWGYNDAGNRVQELRDGLVTTFQYDRDGLVRQVNSQVDGPTLYTWDGNARMVQKDSSRACFQFQYDQGGSLAQILKLGSRWFAPAYEYQYDALGRRIQRTAWQDDGSLDLRTDFLNASLAVGAPPFCEDSSGPLGIFSTSRLWGNGLLGSRDVAGAWLDWSVQDGQGSVIGATNAQGTQAGWRTRYNAFGVEVLRIGNPGCYGYLGGLGVRSDGDAGLLFSIAGPYDPGVGAGYAWPDRWPALDGDYSSDGVVDAADYIVWRRGNHTTVAQDTPRLPPPIQDDPTSDDDLYHDFFKNRDPFEWLPEPPKFTTPPKVPDPSEYNPFDPAQRRRRQELFKKLPAPKRRQLGVASGWLQK